MVVTGCDTGFGRLIALEMHRMGATVFAGCINPKSVQDLNDLNSTGGTGNTGSNDTCPQTRGQMRAFLLDVTKDDQVASAAEQVRASGLRVAAVVNNAGVSAFGWAEGLDLKAYQVNMDVNFFGTVRMTKAFLPMLRAHRGRLVNMGSIGAAMPSAFGSAYLATKAAMVSYSHCVRQEVGSWTGTRTIIHPPSSLQCTS